MMTVHRWYQIAGETRRPLDEQYVQSRELDGVTGYFIAYHGESPLDTENAIGLDILPMGEIDSYMADYRSSPHWCSPYFGHDLSHIPDETQGLLYLKKDGTWGAVLPVVDETYKCVLCGNP